MLLEGATDMTGSSLAAILIPLAVTTCQYPQRAGSDPAPATKALARPH
jgi:hypothetical protein